MGSASGIKVWNVKSFDFRLLDANYVVHFKIKLFILSECAANEEYSTCGTACPDICNAKTPLKCSVSDCIVGCFCKKGWVRNNDGACIKPNECVPDRK